VTDRHTDRQTESTTKNKTPRLGAEIKKGKGKQVIVPLSRHCHHRGTQVHGAHQAASHIPALYLPSLSRYSFTDPKRM